jgi:AraC-like DNA-binding protein
MAEDRLGTVRSKEDVRRLLLGGSKALARQAGVSRRTLRRQFRRSGTTLREIVIAKRAAVVLNLLQAGLPLRMVAVGAGLSSSPSLVRFVKREFGTTPARLAAQLARGNSQTGA